MCSSYIAHVPGEHAIHGVSFDNCVFCMPNRFDFLISVSLLRREQCHAFVDL